MFKKQTSTVVGILIVALFAGAVGVSVFLLNQEDKEVMLLEEEVEYEKGKEMDIDEDEDKKEVKDDNLGDWKTHFHHKYPYSMKYPANWQLSRLELVYGLTDSYIFESPSGVTLVFGAVPKESNEKVGLRTGVQAGYFADSNKTIMIADVEVRMEKLVCWSDGKTLELSINDFEVNEYKGNAYINYNYITHNYYDEDFDLMKSSEMTIVRKILASFSISE